MYKLVKKNGKIVARFTDDVETVQCDFCGQIVPIRYTERFFLPRDGYHDGRDGYHFRCRDVFGGSGKIHNKCRT
jgi:hypothetical protein